MQEEHLAEMEEYLVVVNHEEQYSIWPAFKEIPSGWRGVDVKGEKQVCLDYINETWTDMRPLSLRKALENPQSENSSLESMPSGV